MDIVDDVIRHLGLRSRVAYRLRDGDDWASALRDSPLLQLHCVLDGRCWYRVDTQADAIPLHAGEVLMLPRGGRVQLLQEPTHPTRPGEPAHAQCQAPRILILGVDVELASRIHHPLFAGLPGATLARRAAFRATGTRQHAGYLIDQSGIAQRGDHSRGAESAIIDRLVDILLIQTLKAHYAASGNDQPFVRALHDPAITRAVVAIHAAPGHNWCLERLAAASGLSRSVFSRRFTTLTGVPAMQYLTQWRMHIALEQLRAGVSDPETIAHAVGYLSPTAFRKTFKRVHGFTPAQAATDSG